MQSPVNIKATAREKLPPIYFHYPLQEMLVGHTGYTVQLDPPKGGGGYILIEDDRFDLVQFHFHHPAEHRIDNRLFALEVHFVHRHQEKDQTAVVGVLAEVGVGHLELQRIIDVMPHKGGVSRRVWLDPAKLLPATAGYYRLMGSLTTPPYSEGILWLVMSEVIEVSSEQVACFEAVVGHNARALQDDKNRAIILSEPPYS